MTPGFILFLIFVLTILAFAFGQVWIGTVLLTVGLLWLLAFVVIAVLAVGFIWWFIHKAMGV